MKYNKAISVILVSFFVVFYLISQFGYTTGPDGVRTSNTSALQKVTNTLFNSNNISGWISWDGLSGYNPILAIAGVIYPRSTANVIFQDGVIWGGYVNDGMTPALRVGGQTYHVGTQPGRIISIGVPQSMNDPDVRIYRIRRDYLTVSNSILALDASEFYNIPINQVTQLNISFLVILRIFS